MYCYYEVHSFDVNIRPLKMPGHTTQNLFPLKTILSSKVLHFLTCHSEMFKKAINPSLPVEEVNRDMSISSMKAVHGSCNNKKIQDTILLLCEN